MSEIGATRPSVRSAGAALSRAAAARRHGDLASEVEVLQLALDLAPSTGRPDALPSETSAEPSGEPGGCEGGRAGRVPGMLEGALRLVVLSLELGDLDLAEVALEHAQRLDLADHRIAERRELLDQAKRLRQRAHAAPASAHGTNPPPSHRRERGVPSRPSARGSPSR